MGRAELVAGHLGDRVKLWITRNEPFIHFGLGHLTGVHAPGLTLTEDQLPVVHHQLLGHGLAVAALRQHTASPVAIANSYSPAWPVGADGSAGSAAEDDQKDSFDWYARRCAG